MQNPGGASDRQGMGFEKLVRQAVENPADPWPGPSVNA